jgi:hypothetical protein
VARGSAENPANRFERLAYAEDPEFVDDAPARADDRERALPTRYYRDPSRTLIARNESPDVGFDASINPYRGCSHGVPIVMRGRRTNTSASPPGSTSRRTSS